MATEQDYLALQERHRALLSQRAVLEAHETVKEQRREELKKEIRELGADPDNPDAEIARLEKEGEEDFQRQRQLVDDFERKLKQPTAVPAMPTVEIPESQPAAAESVSSSLSDIDI